MPVATHWLASYLPGWHEVTILQPPPCRRRPYGWRRLGFAIFHPPGNCCLACSSYTAGGMITCGEPRCETPRTCPSSVQALMMERKSPTFISHRVLMRCHFSVVFTQTMKCGVGFNVLLCRGETWVARLDGHVVGFLTLIGDDLDQLYLRPGHYRRGIGSLLLTKAKERSAGRLHLFTFQRNERARAFYEAHGFRIVNLSDGSRNEEGEPDVLYEWLGDQTTSTI